VEFWRSQDQTDKAYRDAIYDATRRTVKPIVTTRIFIFPYQVIAKRRDDIAFVLSEQMREGMHWAIAVEEDEKPYRPRDAKPDFALFDHDRAISYFRHERRFDVTFNAHRRSGSGEESEIELQIRAYRVLLTHCWLATSGFAQKHLASDDEATLLPRVNGRTNLLRELKFEYPERLFPLLVGNTVEIRAALDEMLDLRSKVLARR
jgi:hypothetical protein